MPSLIRQAAPPMVFLRAKASAALTCRALCGKVSYRQHERQDKRRKPTIHSDGGMKDMDHEIISLNGAWEMRPADEPAWMPATVPGSVYADLMDNGRMEDPFWRDN